MQSNATSIRTQFRGYKGNSRITAGVPLVSDFAREWPKAGLSYRRERRFIVPQETDTAVDTVCGTHQNL